MQITVVGQGYVGLPLAIAAAESGVVVFGLDSDKGRINDLCKGISPLFDIPSDVIGKNLNSKNYKPTTDISVIAESEIILICVPTPITVERTPDLSFLINAISSVAKNLRKGSLIIIESTIEPGTCKNLLLPILLKESRLGADDFDLAYSPERIDPANLSWTIKNTPKLLAGLSSKAVERSYKFYNQFVDSITICSSIEIAETAKLLENSFRLINISFINEISNFCQKLGIDVTEVIKAAATKPYGFMPFYPSVGVGGHCIPVDPLYLSNKARELGASTRFIDLADQINQEMPGYFVGRAEEKLGSLKAKKVLVVGVSYKPNVADIRESPVASLIAGLRQKNAHVFWHDDLVKEWNGEKSVALSKEFDLAILATPHDYLDLKKLGDVPILNTRGSI
jgi:UDP-N-acetyl-D-glucosamine dehydrogenase